MKATYKIFFRANNEKILKFVSFLFRFYFPEWKNRQLKSVERFVAENFPNLFIQQMGLSSNEKKSVLVLTGFRLFLSLDTNRKKNLFYFSE